MHKRAWADVLGGGRDRPVMRMLLSSCSWASWSAVAATSLTSHQFLHINTPVWLYSHSPCKLRLDIRSQKLDERLACEDS